LIRSGLSDCSLAVTPIFGTGCRLRQLAGARRSVQNRSPNANLASPPQVVSQTACRSIYTKCVNLRKLIQLQIVLVYGRRALAYTSRSRYGPIHSLKSSVTCSKIGRCTGLPIDKIDQPVVASQPRDLISHPCSPRR
jgi:hypothetical protein